MAKQLCVFRGTKRELDEIIAKTESQQKVHVGAIEIFKALEDELSFAL